MSTGAGTGSGTGAWVRRTGLGLVMIGALSVSVRGQVQAVEPLLGGMSIVLALTNDLAALLALNEAISTRRREVRAWAWAVLVLAGGTAAGLNTWHAIATGLLPVVWAVVVGIGPVLLAMVLSHLVALVLEDASPTPVPTPVAERSSPAVDREPRTATLTASAPVPAVESSRAGQVTADTLTGPGLHPHPALAVVLASGVLPPEAPRSMSPAGRGSGVDPRVARLEAQLRAGVELTGTVAAELLGCSERTGRRLLRQAEDRRGIAAIRGTG